jgi:hypothetical protein
VGAIEARRVEKENTLGRSPWQPTRREKNASRVAGVAPDAAAARRRRLARVGDAGEWGTERRKSDSARGRSSAAARERSFASSSIHGVSLSVRSEESIPH